jgi:2-alkyl-3-oxoalkanoate reductase
MKVFVAGATGAVGRRLVPHLIWNGHTVVGTTRSRDKFQLLHSLGADAVLMDGLDPVEVQDVVAAVRPDAIVHQMTALGGDFDLKHFDRTFAETNRLRTEGTRNLLAAAAAAGVERFVAQSYTGWNNGEPATSQRRTLAAIEELESLVRGTGTILRYGNFYGPGASEQFVELVRRRAIPVIGDGAGVWSWIHVDDAASAAVAAVERNTPGVYDIVDDDPAPVSEWLPALAAAVGAKPPRRVPVWLGRALAGEATARMMTAGRGVSNEKAKRELGWQPRWSTWRDGFREALVDEEPIAA